MVVAPLKGEDNGGVEVANRGGETAFKVKIK
jgi:hypothetical protein